MRRFAVWGVSIVVTAVAGCTYDFDAPFAESGGEGGGASTGSITTGGGAPSTSTGSGGAGAGGDPSGVTTTTTTTSTTTSGGGPVSLPCGDGDCSFDAGDGGCCWSPADAQAECFTSPPSNSDCRTSAQVGSREALIRCHDASDCGGGQQCCASYVLDGTDRVYSVVSCSAACSGSATPLCDPAAEDPCPASEATCQPADGLPPDYFGCLF